MKPHLFDEKQTAAGRVKATLRERIFGGIYSPGCQLRQDKLAAELGVSHIPVREALIQLANEGLVFFLPYRGAVVASLTSEELWSLYQVRAILEMAATRQAVSQITEETLKELEDLLRQCRYTEDMETLWRLHWQFHEILYSAAGNPRLLDLIKRQLYSAGCYLRIYLEKLADLEQFQSSHETMLRCCREGDGEGAAAELERVIMESARQICDYLEDHSPKGAAKRTKIS